MTTLEINDPVRGIKLTVDDGSRPDELNTTASQLVQELLARKLAQVNPQDTSLSESHTEKGAGKQRQEEAAINEHLAREASRERALRFDQLSTPQLALLRNLLSWLAVSTAPYSPPYEGSAKDHAGGLCWTLGIDLPVKDAEAEEGTAENGSDCCASPAVTDHPAAVFLDAIPSLDVDTLGIVQQAIAIRQNEERERRQHQQLRQFADKVKRENVDTAGMVGNVMRHAYPEMQQEANNAYSLWSSNQDAVLIERGVWDRISHLALVLHSARLTSQSSVIVETAPELWHLVDMPRLVVPPNVIRHGLKVLTLPVPPYVLDSLKDIDHQRRVINERLDKAGHEHAALMEQLARIDARAEALRPSVMYSPQMSGKLSGNLQSAG